MPWDPMPHTVCHDCIRKLNSFNDFYEASLKAERLLRALHPSVPQTELENVEPVVHVMDPSTPNRSTLKLPPKKRQSTEGSQMDFGEVLKPPDGQPDEPFAKRALDSFIINQITTRDSVFTCRGCYRTFTKQSTALSHSCVTLEDCAMLESLGVAENEKSLPPLKIRLFSVRSGLFVCYLCQTPFENKTDLVDHIKRHFVDEDLQNEMGKPTGKRRRRPKKEDGSGWEETNKKKAPPRKRRKSSETPKKRGRKPTEVSDLCHHEACKKCGRVPESPKTPARETVERMTQCSDVVSSSEVKNEEIEILPYPDEDSVEMLLVNRPQPVNEANETNESEDRTGIFETDWSPSSFSSFANTPEAPIERDNEVLTTPNSDKKPDEIAVTRDGGDKSDEVTVLEVISNKAPTSFSSCVFCDKIFATKDALIAHQNKHLQNFSGGPRPEDARGTRPTEATDAFLCSICAMTFSRRETLLQHELFHRVEEETVEKIRIALNPHPPQQALQQDCQISKGREILTITVTSTEKKMPQIQLI